MIEMIRNVGLSPTYVALKRYRHENLKSCWQEPPTVLCKSCPAQSIIRHSVDQKSHRKTQTQQEERMSEDERGVAVINEEKSAEDAVSREVEFS
jgi:hypothetical protein